MDDDLIEFVWDRAKQWNRHFRWDGPVLVGRTPIGRATIMVLKINHPKMVEVRAFLIEAGLFPSV
jgi:hypothetical protein